ncbi:signal recognition particle receptor FtsY [Clostridia bacterium]|nr:signal recognition particle receptor FtsY [Clostridia bacterium]
MEREDEQKGQTMEAEAEVKEKKGFFSRLVKGLQKTSMQIGSGVESIFQRFSSLDQEFYEEIEEILVLADVGVHTSMSIVEELKKKVKEQKIKKPDECRELLMQSMVQQMDLGENSYLFEEKTSVLLLVGVNGVGKTTSTAKLAANLKAQGKKVLLAAADTFRAAATEQLSEWAKKTGVELIAHQEGSDPAAVIYDAVSAAKSRKTDVLLCDTAGRLHNKKNLMEELKKIDRIIQKEFPNAHQEVFVVVDGTTGQNALEQVRQFQEVTQLSGIILTKLDGTAKGGVAVAIQAELGVPVKYIGIGEKADDLQKFNAKEYVQALLQKVD